MTLHPVTYRLVKSAETAGPDCTVPADVPPMHTTLPVPSEACTTTAASSLKRDLNVPSQLRWPGAWNKYITPKRLIVL